MGKKAKAKPKAKKKKKRKRKTRVVANPEWPKIRVKPVSKPKTTSYLLSPKALPELSFSGQLIGTATWSPAFIVRKRGKAQKRLTHLDLYKLEGKDEAKYLAHINYADHYEGFYAGKSAIHLLIKLRENPPAARAVATLVKPRLCLNDSQDFRQLLRLAQRNG